MECSKESDSMASDLSATQNGEVNGANITNTGAMAAGFREARARQIFTMELEFVQSLSNPDYLQWLAKNRYFEEQEFINYLSYLQYWKMPEYASSLLFPQCLRILDALQDPKFREKLCLNDAIIELKRQQSHQWIYFDRTWQDIQKHYNYQV